MGLDSLTGAWNLGREDRGVLGQGLGHERSTDTGGRGPTGDRGGARPRHGDPVRVPGAPSPLGLLGLQRVAGNRAASLLVQRAIDLKDHENAQAPTKGHAVTQHVDVDNDYLKARGKAVATRFKDAATANSMAETAVADGTIATRIGQMKSGAKPNATGGVTTGVNGIAYVKSSNSYVQAKNVLIEIYPYTGEKEPLKTLGYYIMTMYPKDPTATPAT